MNRNSILDFIVEIKHTWCASENEEARKRGEKLSKIIQSTNIISDHRQKFVRGSRYSLGYASSSVPKEASHALV